jgi:hypothetical protein
MSRAAQKYCIVREGGVADADEMSVGLGMHGARRARRPTGAADTRRVARWRCEAARKSQHHPPRPTKLAPVS